jgi:hypothetical protein
LTRPLPIFEVTVLETGGTAMVALFYAIAYFVLGAQLLDVDAAMAERVWVTVRMRKRPPNSG